MKPKTVTLTYDIADVDFFVTTVTPGGAGSFTLAHTTVTYSPRKISFTSDGDESGDTYTVVGSDRYGRTITETVTGPNATTVYSTYDYSAVTSIATSGAGTGNITIGIADKADTQWIPVEYRIGTAYSVVADQSSGAAYIEIQGTPDDPFSDLFNEQTCATVEVGETAVRAIRARITEIDGSSGLTLKLTIICS